MDGRGKVAQRGSAQGASVRHRLPELIKAVLHGRQENGSLLRPFWYRWLAMGWIRQETNMASTWISEDGSELSLSFSQRRSFSSMRILTRQAIQPFDHSPFAV